MDDVENEYNEAIAKAQEALEDLKENGGGDLKDQIAALKEREAEIEESKEAISKSNLLKHSLLLTRRGFQAAMSRFRRNRIRIWRVHGVEGQSRGGKGGAGLGKLLIARDS